MNIEKQSTSDNAVADIGIVADDLTSAADGAAPFVGRGFVCIVGRAGKLPQQGEVRAIDTESRSLSEREAARVTAAAVQEFRTARLLYKTIDSTLRGHLKAEIKSAFSASRRRWLIVAPAFPDAGRTTLGGIQYVDGVPVSQTVYARDPVCPARTAKLVELIDTSLGQPVIVDTETGIPPDTLLSAHRVLLLDAQTQAALDRFVAGFPRMEDALWVGSPGIARALASSVFRRDETPLSVFSLDETPLSVFRLDETPLNSGAKKSIAHRQLPDQRRRTAHRVLVALGSLNPASREQSGTLQQYGIAVLEAGAAAPAQSAVVCLKTPDAIQPDAQSVLLELSGHAAKLIRNNAIDVLIATGGATMTQILAALDVQTFELAGELEPGFPVGHARLANPDRELLIALKAGGFGDKNTLLAAVRTLLEQYPATVLQRQGVQP